MEEVDDIKTVFTFKSHYEKYGYGKTPEEDDKDRQELGKIYELIIKVLRRYCDLEDRYYSLIALWIIGTYFHEQFQTYPYLFFNAMKSSGKSRLLRLITYLSKDGCMLNSLTEAVLFRTTGTLGIDEFEGLNRKGKENLTELLNSAYKKGIKVKRMKKVKTFTGEEQQVEEFSVFRPIVLANISGLDTVLGDRCFTIILNKSNRPEITKRIELYENDTDIHAIKHFPYKTCSRCSVDVVQKLYNSYLDNIYIYTLTTHNNTNYTNIEEFNDDNNKEDLCKKEREMLPLFNKIMETEIDGRHLELSIPLLLLADYLSQDVLEELLNTLKTFVEEKKNEDVVENLDVSLIDFISQENESIAYVSIKELFNNFKNSIGITDEWFNEKWMGRALKRLNLITEKKRMRFGMMVKLNYKKAQEKIRMFK